MVTGRGLSIIGLYMLWQEEKAGGETHDVEISSYAPACAPLPTPSTACAPYFHCAVQTEEESTYTYNMDGGIFPWTYVFLRKRWCIKTKPRAKMNFSESQLKWRSAFHNTGLADFISINKGSCFWSTHLHLIQRLSAEHSWRSWGCLHLPSCLKEQQMWCRVGGAGDGAKKVGWGVCQPEEKPDPGVQSNTRKSPSDRLTKGLWQLPHPLKGLTICVSLFFWREGFHFQKILRVLFCLFCFIWMLINSLGFCSNVG